jgi:hypothetical protein
MLCIWADYTAKSRVCSIYCGIDNLSLVGMALRNDCEHTLLLPPYIEPQISVQITKYEWNNALKLWASSLSLLIKSNNEQFAIQLCENASLKRFLETFVQVRAKIHETTSDLVSQEVKVLEKKVLAVLLRAVDRNVIYDSIPLAEILYHKELFSVPFLLDFVIVYGKSNRNYSKQFVENLIDIVPALIHEFKRYSNVIVDHVLSVQRLCQKVTSLTIDSSDNAEVLMTATEEMHDYLFLMMDIAIMMDCLFTVSDIIARLFVGDSHVNENEDFLSVLRNFYDLTLPTILGLIQGANAVVEEITNDINILKQALASAVYRLLYGCFFVPLGFTADEFGTLKLTLDNKDLHSDGVSVAVNSLNEMLFSFIEHSELVKPVQSFVDAPLLLDIEMEFNLSHVLTRIRNDILQGYPLTQLNV